VDVSETVANRRMKLRRSPSHGSDAALYPATRVQLTASFRLRLLTVPTHALRLTAHAHGSRDLDLMLSWSWPEMSIAACLANCLQ